MYLFCVDVVEVVDDRRAFIKLGARVRVAEERHLEAALLVIMRSRFGLPRAHGTCVSSRRRVDGVDIVIQQWRRRAATI